MAENKRNVNLLYIQGAAEFSAVCRVIIPGTWIFIFSAGSLIDFFNIYALIIYELILSGTG
jgi:hypothetical protein